MSLKFGLNIQKKAQNASNRPGAAAKTKRIFDEEEEDDAVKGDGASEIGEFSVDDPPEVMDNSSKSRPSSKPKSTLSGPPSLKPKAKKDDLTLYGNAATLQFAQSKINEAEQLDPSIYDYDAAYDAIHAKREAKKAAEKADAEERRPKYIEKLFESTEIRKRDLQRARDKVIQREREAEGDEFADKEKFVTEAYKAQQEETKRLEEEEKRKQEEEEKRRGKLGMQGFYRKRMDEEERRHQEVVEAADQVAKGGLKIEAEGPKEKTDVDIARELNEKGKNIIINDEGQVADKRQLLSAGLNIVAKPKTAATSSSTSARPSGSQPLYRGSKDRMGVRERQSKMMEEQLEQATKRAADEEAEERRKLEHASKSRKTEADISSARERYLQRKREAAAAKGT